LLTLQAALVIVVSGAMIAAVLLSMSFLESRSDRANRYSHAAILVGDVDAGVKQIVALGTQDFAKNILANQGQSLSGVPIAQILQVRDSLSTIQETTAEIQRLVPNDQTAALTASAAGANASFNSFIRTGSPDDFAALVTNVGQLGPQAKAMKPLLLAAAQENQDSLLAATSVTRLSTILAATAMAVVVLTITVIVGRRLRQAAVTAQTERDNLAKTTEAMERRNSQFRALYQVVTEVTESLSTRYVVATAIREAKTLVSADLVDLRLLRKDELVPAGFEQGEGVDIPNPTTVPLGSDASGRAAKRGKTVRVESHPGQETTDRETTFGMRSGIILPLIVGARVVGTLGCWSFKEHAFDEEDERVLEMMASQVATAVAAAEAHEASEQRAQHDPLTNLANRRQLSEDIDGLLADLIFQQRPFAMVMVDIDDFRHFNNDFGHRVGDITLQKVAQVLKSASREADRVYRYGGEEFLLVFVDAATREGERLAERLRKAVEETPLTGEDLAPVGPITISAGVAGFPEEGDRADEILQRADLALLRAKDEGKNRVVVWHPEIEGPRLAA
jgi:diguanylate cyclase (GGDEF)-like protein